MAEENLLDIFRGATKNLCNSVLNQVQDAVVWLNKDRKIVYLEQGRRTDLRPRKRGRSWARHVSRNPRCSSISAASKSAAKSAPSP